MITSMTGFGRYEAAENGKKITVEIRSVNHRYLDINLHMPRRFMRFDPQLRKLLQQYMIRGKVDVNIIWKDDSQAAASLTYHKELAEKYLRYFEEMEKEFGLTNDMTVSRLAALPEVLTMDEQDSDDEALWSVISEAVENAAEAFREARIKEGEALKTDLLDKLDSLLSDVDQVEERFPQIIAEYREKLLNKLEEIKADTTIEESRLAAELVLYSDRLSTDEETVRLRSHILTMKQELIKGGEIGRRLDFLTQEMNREANTILSKANDLKTSSVGINMKTVIEKIREQIQNIE